jgi:DNA polymerase-3 subunit epsilon/ATP-dependent DNA helicase DinG
VANIYVALDIETTGLDPDKAAIIEVGAVKFRGDDVLEEFGTLVNPGRRIPHPIRELTGITDDMVRGKPPLPAVLPRLQRFVGGYPIIGHNVGFDLGFLGRQGAFHDNPRIDTFELASILLPHAGRYSLEKLSETLAISAEAHHRALDDARAAHRLFVALLDQASRLDLSIVQAVNRMAAQSSWSLRPVFADLEQLRTRTVFTTSLGQQLAAKGALSGAGGQGLLRQDRSGDRDEEPLRPATTIRPLDVDRLAAMLDEGGLFAQTLPNYEHRPQQIAMLRHVTGAFNDGAAAMLEAGTGVGKSVAYLLPAIHWATQNGQRVVIATHTINLQDQLLAKDIPHLQSILPIQFKAVALKGRSNYVCPRRVRQLRAELEGRRGSDSLRRGRASEVELRVLTRVLIWMETTLTGDRQELFLPTAEENAVWNSLCSDADLCTPEVCRRENCFFHRARRAADSAHIVVVNHALLLADVAAENRVLPEYRYLVVDEAHHLEDSVTNQLSFHADERSLERLLGELSEPLGVRRYGGYLNTVVPRCRDGVTRDGLSALQERVSAAHEAVEQARLSVQDLFGHLRSFAVDHGPSGGSQYDRRLRLTTSVRRQPAWDQIEIAWDALSARLEQASTQLVELQQLVDRLDRQKPIKAAGGLIDELGGYRVRLETMRDQLKTVIEHDTQAAQSGTITWLEIAAQTEAVSLHAAPLHVGELVRRHLFEATDATILTSATLRTGQSFEYIRERLGAEEMVEIALGSPFDYRASTLVYLPSDIPEPNQPRYQSMLESALIDLVRATRGRTLVLFTSYSQLRNTANAVRERLGEDDILLLEQGGGGSRAHLLERFKSAERCVLFGTRSFWEGIDVTGESLSCVVIAKLPFDVPDDPIFSARSETYADGFNDYSLPNAILRFRQGFGRLIRTRSDRGVVVCMDRRLLTKAYGQEFLRSLPDCTRRQGTLTELPEVARRWIDRPPA